MEDQLRAIWKELRERSDGRVAPATAAKLADFERDLRTARVGHEEWEVLFRDKLLVERSLLQVEAGLTDRPQERAKANICETGAERTAVGARGAAQPQRQPISGLALRVLPLLVVAGLTWFVGGRQDVTSEVSHARVLSEVCAWDG